MKKSLPELFEIYISFQTSEFSLLRMEKPIPGSRTTLYYGNIDNLSCKLYVELNFDCFCFVKLSESVWQEIRGMFGFHDIEIQFRVEKFCRKFLKLDNTYSIIAITFKPFYLSNA